jgi:hypothetical protein
MDYLNPVVFKESAQEVASQENKSPVEEGGKHHNLIGIGCRDILPCSRSPTKHSTIREKVVLN